MEMFGLLFLCFFLPVPVALDASAEDVNTLIEKLLNGYDTRLRPVSNQSQPVNVYVEFNLLGIIEFDEVSEKLTTAGFFTLFWKDTSFSWDNTSKIPYVKIPENQIWKPDLVNSNTLNKITNIGDGERTAIIGPDGSVILMPGDLFKSSCSVDVTYYPYDVQNCQLDFITWNYFNEEVALHLGRDTIKMGVYEENGSWRVLSTSAESQLAPIDAHSSVKFLQFKMKLRRRSSFYIQTHVLPAVLLNVLSFFIFLLPPPCGEKVSFGIAMFLTVAVFLTFIAENMPQTSKTTSVFLSYLSTVMVMVGCNVLVSIIGVYIYNKENNASIPKRLQKLIVKRKKKALEKRRAYEKDGKENKQDDDEAMEATWQDVAILLDLVCFFLFLVVSILLTIIVFSLLSAGQKY